MKRLQWTPLLFLLFILPISSANLFDESTDLRKFDNRVVHRLMTLLEPSNLLSNYVYNEELERDTEEENAACMEDIQKMREALTNISASGVGWPVKMLDASSKLPSGILEGNMIDLGMYDECIAIHDEDSEIRGQHCMYGVNVQQIAGMKLSICLPSTCSVDVIKEFLNATIDSILEMYPLEISQLTVTCTPLDLEIWDTEFIICFSVLVVFIAFLVICTVCEVISERSESCSKNGTMIALTQFSLKKSASAIFNMHISKGNLPVLHGIRCISMAWIVLGHEYMWMSLFPLINRLYVYKDWVVSWNSLYIYTAQFAVDTFFTISGFLLAYVTLKQKTFNILFYYLHRIIRLTPAIIALYAFFVVFVPKVGSGPLWYDTMYGKADLCRRHWWPTFTYLQNFVYQDDCLGHLWYLAVDMQLFLISPAILYPLQRKPKVGLLILAAFFLASIVTPALIIGIREYPIASYFVSTRQELVGEMFNEIYIMPYTRAAPWLMGIYLGYEVVCHQNRKPTKSVAYIGWFLALGGIAFATLFARYFLADGYEFNASLEAIYSAISRPIWAFGICWIIYTSTRGCGGWIVKFLSAPIFLPFSRISYCMYLTHMIVELMQAAGLRTPRHYTDYYVWYYCLPDLAITVVVATLFSLLFESPILVVNKMIFKKGKKPTTEPKKEAASDAKFGVTRKLLKYKIWITHSVNTNYFKTKTAYIKSVDCR